MNQQNLAAPEPRFISLEDTARKVCMGKSTVLAWEATGKFPRAVRLSATKRVWLERAVDNWILDQCAKSADLPGNAAEEAQA